MRLSTIINKITAPQHHALTVWYENLVLDTVCLVITIR